MDAPAEARKVISRAVAEVDATCQRYPSQGRKRVACTYYDDNESSLDGSSPG